MKPFWVVLFATGVPGLEENPFFLEWLAEPSAEKVPGENNRTKMTAQKISCRRAQMGLLNNLTGFFTFLDNTVKPLHFHTNLLLWVPEWQSENVSSEMNGW